MKLSRQQKANKKIIKPKGKADVGKSKAKQILTMELKSSKTRPDIRSNTKLPGVLLNKKVYKYKPLEMDFCIKYFEQLFYGFLLGWGSPLMSFHQELYVIRNVTWCFWMLFYCGDIFSVGGTHRRLSNASCYIMNSGDLCYGEFSLLGELLEASPMHHTIMFLCYLSCGLYFCNLMVQSPHRSRSLVQNFVL
jgi:hypothetical protein